MRIRHYRIADWNAVCSIFDLAKPDEFKGELELPLIPALNNDTKMKALFHESEVFVAEQDGQVVGFAGTCGNYVSWLFVHPLYRRAGVAKNLIQEAIRGLNGTIELTQRCEVQRSSLAPVRGPWLCRTARIFGQLQWPRLSGRSAVNGCSQTLARHPLLTLLPM